MFFPYAYKCKEKGKWVVIEVKTTNELNNSGKSVECYKPIYEINGDLIEDLRCYDIKFSLGKQVKVRYNKELKVGYWDSKIDFVVYLFFACILSTCSLIGLVILDNWGLRFVSLCLLFVIKHLVYVKWEKYGDKAVEIM